MFLFARSDSDLRVARPDAVHAFGATAVFKHGFEHDGQTFAFNHRLLIDLHVELLAQSNHFRLPRLLREQRGEGSEEDRESERGQKESLASLATFAFFASSSHSL